MPDPTPPARPEAEELEEVTGVRMLIVTVDETGDVEMDDASFAAWELVGLASWIEKEAREALDGEDEE